MHGGVSSSLCVRAKNDKFQFAANGMRTICEWRSAGLQSCPHTRAFGLRTVRKWFANHLARSYIYEALRQDRSTG